MVKSDRETKFEKYREYLEQEAMRLTSFIRLYRRLHELRRERLNEMNLAPAFFQTVIDALFSVIIICVYKMFDEKSERGLWNFLTFCEQNLEMLSIKELQRRRKYPDGHFVLERIVMEHKTITFEAIKDDKKLIRCLESFPCFKKRRDKFHAHFDKKYFFDRKQLSKDAPLKWSDLEEVIKIMNEIINKYSCAYDGRAYILEPMNINDIDYLLDRLYWHQKDKT